MSDCDNTFQARPRELLGRDYRWLGVYRKAARVVVGSPELGTRIKARCHRERLHNGAKLVAVLYQWIAEVLWIAVLKIVGIKCWVRIKRDYLTCLRVHDDTACFNTAVLRI